MFVSAGASRGWVLWVVGCVAVASLAACSNNQVKIESRPMPAGASFTGDWYSPQYENMTLTQTGATVRGTFTYKTGGELEGTLDGNVLYFKWSQPGDFKVARRDVSGEGYFVMDESGDSFTGRWGYEDDNHSGGVWDAERLEKRQQEEGFDEPIFKRP